MNLRRGCAPRRRPPSSPLCAVTTWPIEILLPQDTAHNANCDTGNAPLRRHAERSPATPTGRRPGAHIATERPRRLRPGWGWLSARPSRSTDSASLTPRAGAHRSTALGRASLNAQLSLLTHRGERGAGSSHHPGPDEAVIPKSPKDAHVRDGPPSFDRFARTIESGRPHTCASARHSTASCKSPGRG
jgi:hypothetical protein